MSDYVARRIELLRDALDAVDVRQDPAERPLRLALTSELADLAGLDDLEVRERSVELGLLAWLRGLPAGVAGASSAALLAVQADPVLAGLQRASQLSAAAAAAVFQLREQHPLSLADLPALSAAAQSSAAFEELVWAALRQRAALVPPARTYLYRDVAVLLPLGLETVFEQAGAGWNMLLRLVPDEPSILRDEVLPTAQERAELVAMWQAILDELPAPLAAAPPQDWLDTPRARQAWQTFCSRFGGERAAQLAVAHAPTVVDGKVTLAAGPVRARSSPNRVAGFPERVEIWVAFGSSAPQLLDTAEIDGEALTFDVVGARTGGDGSLEHEKDRWWISWEVAQQVGLGRIIPLPAGLGPADIRVLYAIGLGDHDPAAHFAAKIAAGELAVLPLGAPTNSVDGQQAASLNHDALSWLSVAQRRLRHLANGTIDDVVLSQSLGGATAALQAMPRPGSMVDADAALVSGLWSALWGHQLRDLWGCVDRADTLAEWARRYLRPEGPLPPLRIAEQAFGLLPTSALSRWRVAEEEGSVAAEERELAAGLLLLRDAWTQAARAAGTVVGADIERLLELIGRDALSVGYVYRFLLPVSLWHALYASTTGIDERALDAWLRDAFESLHGLLGRPPDAPPGMREYLAVGAAHPLQIPLVTPSKWPRSFYEEDGNGQLRLDARGQPVLAMSPERALAKALEQIAEHGHDPSKLRELWRNVLPDSLLLRLAIASSVLSAAAVVQSDQTGRAPLLEPLSAEAASLTRIAELAARYDARAPHARPADTTHLGVVEGLVRLFKLLGDRQPEDRTLEQLERAFRATLDTAMHRIDPWIVGTATRRLEYLRALPQSRFRLGVYGWVDGPMLGQPGPTPGGLLHAPSHAQALTAVILRDKFISEEQESPAPPAGRNLWSMQLASQSVRLAEELAEEVRLGSHLFEVLGRQVERIVANGDGAPISAVDTLRVTYPMQTGQPDRSVVCHGQDALVGLLDGAAPPIALSPSQREQLVHLRSALDTYGDLLVAEAVHQVVTGHADVAGAAMDAAAGLALPPTLAFTRTPLQGDGLSTTTLLAVPFHAADQNPLPGGSPARIADGSMPEALVQMLGGPAEWTWTRVEGGVAIEQVSLDELGLEPVDTLLWAPDTLESLARFWLSAGRDEALGGSAPVLQRRARALVGAVGAQPAFLRDLAALDESALEAGESSALDDASLTELRARYGVLRDAAQALVDALAAALVASDEVSLNQLVFNALRWGVRPTLTLAEQDLLWGSLLLGVPAGELLQRVARESSAALIARLASAPADEVREPIARKLAELASPHGQLAILSRVAREPLEAKSRLDVQASDLGLDESWLPLVAAVRAPLARLEAIQLESLLEAGQPALIPWSNAAGDPWRSAAVAALRQRRDRAASVVRADVPRLVVTYTMGDLWSQRPAAIALGLIDSWTETVPRPEQASTAAFGFNAPAARPPQAILLAVPADLSAAFGAQLEGADLVQIVSETRELAHARTVEFGRLGRQLAVAPTITLPSGGTSGVVLEPTTTF